MIQILTHSGRENEFEGKEVKVNSIHSPESLDQFEINVVCLADQNLWKNRNDSICEINTKNDLISLSHMINNCKKTQNIILFPQNELFKYSDWGNKQQEDYRKKCELKDMLHAMNKYILNCIYNPICDIDMLYENTKTKIGDKEIAAAFYFGMNAGKPKTFSVGSNKVTTVKNGKVFLSTLNIKTCDELISFLEELNLIRNNQECPEWMEEVKMFDDNKQLKVIEENNQTIAQANSNISKAMEAINKNNKYKSSLYTTGDELVDVVFEILEEMLGCDLSEFQDKKKEDFNFTIGEKVFIGEIKGVTPNVKKANISQVDVHVQEYLDEHEEQKDNIVALLIINHQRNKPIGERERIHEDQVRLAERNGSLIIETITLLKLFEKYLNGEKTRDECIALLKDNTGLLSL